MKEGGCHGGQTRTRFASKEIDIDESCLVGGGDYRRGIGNATTPADYLFGHFLEYVANLEKHTQYTPNYTQHTAQLNIRFFVVVTSLIETHSPVETSETASI